jgi:hypothetical protein
MSKLAATGCSRAREVAIASADNLIAVFLCFFFGGGGVGKFYVGEDVWIEGGRKGEYCGGEGVQSKVIATTCIEDGCFYTQTVSPFHLRSIEIGSGLNIMVSPWDAELN